jgi:hypothetical protein
MITLAALNAHDVTDVVIHESDHANAHVNLALLLVPMRIKRDRRVPQSPIVVASTWSAKCITDWLTERPSFLATTKRRSNLCLR